MCGTNVAIHCIYAMHAMQPVNAEHRTAATETLIIKNGKVRLFGYIGPNKDTESINDDNRKK